MKGQVDITIIGGGPVGLFAAFYAGLRGLSVRIIDSLPELGGQLKALYPEKYIYDMPGFPKILAKDLVEQMAQQGLRFNPEVILEETVTTLEKTDDGFVLQTDKDKRYKTRFIVLAVGVGSFTPTKLGVEREDIFENKGLYYGVRNPIEFQNKSVIIVGGGDSAFDWAHHLEPIASSVKLVHRRDQFRAHEETVRLVQNSSVEMKLWNVVKQLEGKDLLESIHLENLQTNEIEKHHLDALIVNVGYKSSLGPIKNWGIELQKNQIKVDQKFQTNLPGIFAIGDGATYDGKIKLIATGVGEAAAAICYIKTLIDPQAKLFPGHSSDMEL